MVMRGLATAVVICARGAAQHHNQDDRHGHKQRQRHQDPGGHAAPRTAGHGRGRRDRRRKRRHELVVRAPRPLILSPPLTGRAVNKDLAPANRAIGRLVRLASGCRRCHARLASARRRCLADVASGCPRCHARLASGCRRGFAAPASGCPRCLAQAVGRRAQSHGPHGALPGPRGVTAFDLDAREFELRDNACRELDSSRLKLAVGHRMPAVAAQDVQQLCLLLVTRRGPLFSRGTRSTASCPDARGPTSCERNTTDEWPTARIMTPRAARRIGQKSGEI
jgi:hypothetical protein